MSKIKAVSIAVNSADGLFVVDDKGRLWLKQPGNGMWVAQELPEDSDDTNQNRV